MFCRILWIVVLFQSKLFNHIMAGEEGSWRTPAFRQSVVSKIDEAIQRSGMPTAKNSVEMENHVFQKAKTKEEYLSFVARLILHVRELNAKKGQGMNGPAGGAGQTMQDPINALQTLARQGTGNAQMIGLGPQAAGMVPQPPTQIPATNLLQTLNQRPGQPLGGLTSLQNKVPDLGLGPGAQDADKTNQEDVETLHAAEDKAKSEFQSSTQSLISDSLQSSCTSLQSPSKHGVKRKCDEDLFQHLENDVEYLEAFSKHPAVSKHLEDNDYIASFGKRIVAHMRKLPEQYNKELMEEIQSLITAKQLRFQSESQTAESHESK